MRSPDDDATAGNDAPAAGWRALPHRPDWFPRLDGDHARVLAATAALATALLGVAAVRLFGPMPAGTWPELQDSVIFEYVGWYLAEGNRLYLDVWEVKPPATFELAAVLALLAGGDVVLYHVLALLTNAAAVVCIAVATAGVVHELSGDRLASVAGGATAFLLPLFAYRALVGLKAKYLVLAVGLGCCYLALRERPVAAGVAGAVAVGSWQLGVAFPLAGLALLHGHRNGEDERDADCGDDPGSDRDGRRDRGNDAAGATRQFLVAAGVTGAVLLAPVVAWGAVPAMVAEVVLTPLVVPGDETGFGRLRHLATLLGPAAPVALLGVGGLLSGLRGDRRGREWPLVGLLAWFSAQALLLDYDSYPDLFPWLAVVGVGVGLALARGGRLDGDWPGPDPELLARGAAVAVLVLAAVGVGTMGGYGVSEELSFETYDRDTELDPDFDGARTYDATERQYVYWNRVRIPTCRAFGGVTQMRLVNEVGLAREGPYFNAPCGRFWPIWRTVTERYGP